MSLSIGPNEPHSSLLVANVCFLVGFASDWIAPFDVRPVVVKRVVRVVGRGKRLFSLFSFSPDFQKQGTSWDFQMIETQVPAFSSLFYQFLFEEAECSGVLVEVMKHWNSLKTKRHFADHNQSLRVDCSCQRCWSVGPSPNSEHLGTCVSLLFVFAKCHSIMKEY